MKFHVHPDFIYETAETLARICREDGAYGMYVHGNYCALTELQQAAPWLPADHVIDLLNAELYITFDSETEMRNAYNQTVGEDGPGKANPIGPVNTYSGPARVYALSCAPDGKLISENT